MSEPSANPVRQVLRSMTHGVYVLSLNSAGHNGSRDGQAVATRDASHDDYLVVSLAMQCSVQPPRVAFALALGARVLPALRTANGGVLSVLGTNDLAAVRRYGVPGGVKHLPPNPSRTPDGHPVPPEATHWLTFRLFQETVVGDHVLFVADVTGATVAAESERGSAPSSGMTAANAADAEHSTTSTTTHAFHPLSLAATGFPYAG